MKTLFEMINTVLIVAAILTPFSALILYLIWECGKRNMANEKDYNKLFDEIEAEITRCIKLKNVNSHNYDILLDKLKELGQLKFKDKKRTGDLTCYFLRAFGAERCRRLIE